MFGEGGTWRSFQGRLRCSQLSFMSRVLGYSAFGNCWSTQCNWWLPKFPFWVWFIMGYPYWQWKMTSPDPHGQWDASPQTPGCHGWNILRNRPSETKFMFSWPKLSCQLCRFILGLDGVEGLYKAPWYHCLVHKRKSSRRVSEASISNLSVEKCVSTASTCTMNRRNLNHAVCRIEQKTMAIHIQQKRRSKENQWAIVWFTLVYHSEPPGGNDFGHLLHSAQRLWGCFCTAALFLVRQLPCAAAGSGQRSRGGATGGSV